MTIYVQAFKESAQVYFVKHDLVVHNMACKLTYLGFKCCWCPLKSSVCIKINTALFLKSKSSHLKEWSDEAPLPCNNEPSLSVIEPINLSMYFIWGGQWGEWSDWRIGSPLPFLFLSVSSLDAGLWWEIYMVREANLSCFNSVGLKSEQPG